MRSQFVWVPAHIGIIGNEVMDRIIKESLNQEKVSVKVSYGRTELRSKLMEGIVQYGIFSGKRVLVSTPIFCTTFS